MGDINSIPFNVNETNDNKNYFSVAPQHNDSLHQ